MSIRFELNGEPVALDAPPYEPLLWALRDRLSLKGTKHGCGVGACGICVVHLDGEPARACVTPVVAVAGRRVGTIEGLAEGHPVPRAFVAEQVPQCGYCQPGQVMAAAALLARHPEPDEASLAAAMDPVLCRCGTYPRIRRAVALAARWMREGVSGPPPAQRPNEAPHGAVLAPNPWVRVHGDGSVTVVIDRAEMGQGALTGLALLVAEELAVPLSALRTVFAPADPAYTNPLIGEQLTGGSTSTRGAWVPLRRAGAQAREMLVAAAAVRAGVDPARCHADRDGWTGAVLLPDGRRWGYGELVQAATSLPVPDDPPLTPAEDHRLIGRGAPRLDIPAMVRGETVYGLDVDLPGMLHASVLRCPHVAGGELDAFDSAPAQRMPGVRRVLRIPGASGPALAVVADSAHAALLGRNHLQATWKGVVSLSTEQIGGRLRAAAHDTGRARGEQGEAMGALEDILARARDTVAADYTTPYLAHACMEPMDCVAWVQADGCQVWVGTQAQTATRRAAAQEAGVAGDRVRIYTQFLGGGFGRRGDTDFVREAVQVSRAVRAPVKLVWTRADDLHHDAFRPASHTLLRGALGDDGRPLAWLQRVAGPALAHDGIDVPYRIPHLRIETVLEDPGVPTGPWRSVGASQNAFAVEGFIDELAHAAGQDPFAYRHGLLVGRPRLQGVLALAAEKAGWGRPPPGRHQGIACCTSFRSHVAQVAEVSVAPDGRVTVHRVVCVVDCGTAVNPDQVVAQMEGGIVFGLSAALFGRITLEDGRVQQDSFDDYPILRLSQTPDIQVHIVPSHDPPGGVGEPGVPPVAPAVANAIFAATGRRPRSLPLAR